jgi:hypothetical protein
MVATVPPKWKMPNVPPSSIIPFPEPPVPPDDDLVKPKTPEVKKPRENE